MYTNDLYPELKLRWEKIQKRMKKDGVEAIILSSSANLFYAAGRVFNGYIYITQEGDPFFFVRRPAGINDGKVQYIRKPEDIVDKLKEAGVPMPVSVGYESDYLTYNEYVRISALFPDVKVHNANTILREVRAIKTDYEIEKLKESAIRHVALYRRIPGIYQEGMTDDELSIEIEYASRKLGSLGLFRIFGSSMEIFMGSVIAGDNADNPSPYDFAMGGAGMNSSLPVGANGTYLRPGMTVMVDIGGNFTGYMTDMTRVFAIREVRNEFAIQAHQCSIDIQEAIVKVARPGVEAKDLYEIALNIVKERHLEDYFMGYTQKAGFIGHGVGIEINELPVIAPKSRHVLEEGMTFALEPKFVIPEVGAVGIENTFVVRKDGIELLTDFEENIIDM